MQTASDVLERVKRRIGRLAERVGDPSLTPNSSDDAHLQDYLGDGLRELAKKTERLEDTLALTTTAGQGYVLLPPHLDVVQEATVDDGGQTHEMSLYDGAETAHAVQSQSASSGRPKSIGSHSGKLWLHPVPDKAYTITLTAILNGEHGDTAPSDDSEPPTLDTLVEKTPAELERAVVSYVVAEWMADSGQPDAAQPERQRALRDFRKYGSDPNRQRTHERNYTPLGGIL